VSSPEPFLTLRCTVKVLKLVGHTAAPRLVEAAPSDDDWYVNLLWLDRRKCLLPTHVGTLFSVLVADVLQADLKQIGPLAVALIEGELDAEGLPTETFGRLDPARVRLAKTASRSVLGCMNDMAFICKIAVIEARSLAYCDIPALNRELRRNINSPRGYARPIDLAAEWPRTNPDSGLALLPSSCRPLMA
jgi:hypothetical protein